MQWFLSFLVFVSLGLPVVASAATYHVKQGQGGNCTTASTPTGAGVSTIVAGMHCLQAAGDILQIHNGTYAESWVTSEQGALPAGTSWSNPVTIMAAPGESPVWTPIAGCDWFGPANRQDNCAWPLRIQSSSERFIRFQGLIFDGLTTNNPFAATEVGTQCGDPANLGNNPSDIEFKDVTWRNFHSELSICGRRYTFTGGSAHHFGDSSGFRHVFYPGIMEDLLIENMDIHHLLGGFVLHLNHQAAGVDPNRTDIFTRTIFRGNYVHDLSTIDDVNGANGITVGSAQDTKIYNNVFAGIDWGAIGVGHNGPNTGTEVYYNTIYDACRTPGCGNSGFYALFAQLGTNPIFKNNITSNSHGRPFLIFPGVTATADHNNFDQVDSQFLDRNNGDFRIPDTSPDKGQGVTVSVTNVDKNNIVRPNPPSRGAYEPGGSPAQPRVKGTYFISPGATNTTNCTAAMGALGSPSTQPMPDIATVAPCMAQESTLYLRAGAYASFDSGNVLIPGGSSWANPMLISAYPGDAAVTIQGGTYLHDSTNNAFIVIAGLVFDGLTTFNNALYFENIHDIHVQNCEMKQSQYHNLGIAQSQSITCDTCNIHNTSQGTPMIGVSGSSDVYLVNSTISNSSGLGIAIDPDVGGLPSTNVFIEKSVVSGNAGGGVYFAGGTGFKLYNSLVYSNGTTAYGLHLGNAEAGSQVYYNTFWGNSAGCMLYDNGMTGGQFTNNICWASATITNNAGSGMVGTTNQITDPSFTSTTPVDPGFLHLANASTARDTGTPIGAVTTDKTGKTRPAPGTSGVDKGAYEEDAVTGPASPAPALVSPYKTTRYHFQW